jgi:hypothetical protein
MTTTTTSPAPEAGAPTVEGGRAMTNQECRSWLMRHGEGRLGYLSGRGPRSVVIAYALNGRAIMMRIPDYNEMAQYVPGRSVTLDVTGFATEDAIERVQVTGQAAVCETIGAGDLIGLPDEGWPEDLSTVTVSVPLEDIQGQVVPASDRIDAPTCL